MKERLTEWRNGHGALIRGDGYTKLARYEDCGLEPEEIEELLHDSTVPLHKKLGEWICAEREGRLRVLPCKIGDKVFIPHRGRVDELEIGNITDNVFYTRDAKTGIRDIDLYPNDFMRYVFLTREEAESALKEGAK